MFGQWCSGAVVQWCRVVQFAPDTSQSTAWRGFEWCSGANPLHRPERSCGASGAVVQPPAPTGHPVCCTGAPERGCRL